MVAPYRKGWRDPEKESRNLQMYREYWSGATGPELAKKYGLNYNWVYTILRRMEKQHGQEE